MAATSQNELVSDWSRDGKYLLYHQSDPEAGPDLWYLERGEDDSGWEPQPFLQEPSVQISPKFSPNGRYVAYVSAESGQLEVYVQPCFRVIVKCCGRGGSGGALWNHHSILEFLSF